MDGIYCEVFCHFFLKAKTSPEVFCPVRSNTIWTSCHFYQDNKPVPLATRAFSVILRLWLIEFFKSWPNKCFEMLKFYHPKQWGSGWKTPINILYLSKTALMVERQVYRSLLPLTSCFHWMLSVIKDPGVGLCPGECHAVPASGGCVLPPLFPAVFPPVTATQHR